jgi:hypothetical protein
MMAFRGRVGRGSASAAVLPAFAACMDRRFVKAELDARTGLFLELLELPEL